MSMDQTQDAGTKPPSMSLLELLIQFPFRLIWNLIVIVGAISLTIAWLGFVFGSVIGVILLLIFFPEGFLLPMTLLAFLVRL